MTLQLGMRVKIKNDAKEFGENAGIIKIITKELPYFNNKRAFQLDDENWGLWLIEDFERCEDYPNLIME